MGPRSLHLQLIGYNGNTFVRILQEHFQRVCGPVSFHVRAESMGNEARTIKNWIGEQLIVEPSGLGQSEMHIYRLPDGQNQQWLIEKTDKLVQDRMNRTHQWGERKINLVYPKLGFFLLCPHHPIYFKLFSPIDEEAAVEDAGAGESWATARAEQSSMR